MQRIEKTFKREDVLTSLLLALAVSRNGLTEGHLLNIVAQCSGLKNKYSDIEAYIKGILIDLEVYIIKKSGQYVLFSGIFGEAILKKYAKEIDTFRRDISSYFEHTKIHKDVRELYFQLHKLKDWEKIYKLLLEDKCFEFFRLLSHEERVRYAEGVQLNFNLSGLLLEYLKNFKKFNFYNLMAYKIILLLNELEDEETFYLGMDEMLTVLKSTKVSMKELDVFFELAITASLKSDRVNRFRYLRDYMEILETLYGGVNKKILKIYKIYGDICLEIYSKTSLIRRGGGFNLKQIAKFMVLSNGLIEKTFGTYEDKNLFASIMDNEYAMKCKDMFPQWMQRHLQGSVNDAIYLYDYVYKVFEKENRKGELGLQCKIQKSVFNMMTWIYAVDTIQPLIECYEDIRKVSPFFDLKYGEICKKLGQYYLQNPGENKENIEKGFQFYYKAIVIFMKMKGLLSDEFFYCIEGILNYYFQWGINSFSVSDYNVNYLYDFYGNLCMQKNVRKKRYIYLYMERMSLKKDMILYPGLNDICSYLDEVTSFKKVSISLRMYKVLRRKTLASVSIMGLILVPILYASALLANITDKNPLTHKKITVPFENTHGAMVVKDSEYFLSRGSLLYSAFDSENCYYSKDIWGNGIARYNWILDRTESIYSGKAKLLKDQGEGTVYFLDEKRYLRCLQGNESKVVLSEPVYKYCLHQDKIYYIPFEESTAPISFNLESDIEYTDSHLPSKIMECNLKGENKRILVDCKTSSISPLGDKLYYIEKSTLYSLDLLDGNKEWICGDVYEKGLYASPGHILYFNEERKMMIYIITQKKSKEISIPRNDICMLATFNNCDFIRLKSKIYFYPFSAVNTLQIKNKDSRRYLTGVKSNLILNLFYFDRDYSIDLDLVGSNKSRVDYIDSTTNIESKYRLLFYQNFMKYEDS